MADAEYRRLVHLKPNLERRALIYQFTRDFFRERGFLEVETPVRVSEVAPEQHITPFASEDWFLSTSPELHMKRVLAAGYDKIFQFSHCFRKGEQGRGHNPEFTMLEWYRSRANYQQMIHDTEQLIVMLANELQFGHHIQYQNQDVDLTLPWPKVTVRNAFRYAAGWDPLAEFDPERFDIDLVTKVIPSFPPCRPIVLLDYPAVLASLACLKPSEPVVAERAEVFIGGLELANAYSELRDQREQVRRFREEIRQIQRETGREMVIPRKFLKELVRLPECGGIALGIDRLVMFFCDAGSIDEVILFTVDRI